MPEAKVKPFRITERAYHSLSDGNGGFCTACREEAYGVEPDARKVVCEVCDEPAVYGVEELLIMGLIELK